MLHYNICISVYFRRISLRSVPEKARGCWSRKSMTTQSKRGSTSTPMARMRIHSEGCPNASISLDHAARQCAALPPALSRLRRDCSVSAARFPRARAWAMARKRRDGAGFHGTRASGCAHHRADRERAEPALFTDNPLRSDLQFAVQYFAEWLLTDRRRQVGFIPQQTAQ